MKRAHFLTASKVDLGVHCLYWARSDVFHEKRPVGPAAQRGKRIHEANDARFKGRPTRFINVEEEAVAGMLWAWCEPRKFTSSEVALIYDTEHDTAEECATGEDEHDYLGVTATKIPMRLDLVRVGEQHLSVWDIKTGSRSNVAPAIENQQIATQGVAASRFYDRAAVRAGLVFPLKTKVHEDATDLDGDALDAHAGRLRRMLRMIPDSMPAKGEHCWRCPIGPAKGFLSTCPAWAYEDVA